MCLGLVGFFLIQPNNEKTLSLNNQELDIFLYTTVLVSKTSLA